MSLKPARRNSVFTLSSSNLQALKQVNSDLIESRKAKEIKFRRDSVVAVVDETHVIEIPQAELLQRYVVTDFWNNLTIVTLPACFTNFIWRLMNLQNIAVSHNFWRIIGETTYEIATVVFMVSFIVDISRQCYLYQQIQKYDSYSQIFNAYYSNWGLLSSLHLSFKFFMVVIFWTIGYGLVADDHQIYINKDDAAQTIYRAFSAGIGGGFGLLIASEIITLTEYYSGLLVSLTRLKPYSADESKIQLKRKGFFRDTNQIGIFGVSFKGCCEGIVWSILADADLYLYMENSGMGENGSVILDSLVVSIFASLSFTFGGIITSLLGFCQRYTVQWQRKTNLLSEIRKQERDESIFDHDAELNEVDSDAQSDVSDLSAEYEPLMRVKNTRS